MKAVMISIQPKWCELIVNGQKTIEVRKTRPNIKTPFKCYIYMTQGTYKDLGTYCDWIYENRMKVIGEFVCDRIYEIKNLGSSFMIGNDIALTNRIARESCLDYDDMIGYLGNKDGYAWHISELKIYDKPCNLDDFGLSIAPASWRYIKCMDTYTKQQI